MLSSVVVMPHQPRPTGTPDTVDDEWKDAVREALKTKGISRRDLALQIGVTPSAITVLLRPGTSSTRLAGKVAKALGMRTNAGRPVAAAVVDDSLERVLRSWRKMTAKQRETLAALAEDVAAAASKP